MGNARTTMWADLPCWYELSWQSEPPAIILRVRKDFVEYFYSKVQMTAEVNMVRALMESLKLKTFDTDLRSFFGFDGAFGKVTDEGDFLSFVISLPCVRVFTENLCTYCNIIAGRRDPDCYLCDGTGKEIAFEQKPLWTISASLRVFCFMAEFEYPFSEFVTKCDKFQLFLFHLAVQMDMNGFHITGEYSRRLTNWLSLLSQDEEKKENTLERIRQAVAGAHKQMHGKLRDYEDSSIQAVMYNKGFHICVPGNACGIDPGEPVRDEGDGYQFSGHNIDSPLQQLAMVAGLAALHDEARKAGV